MKDALADKVARVPSPATQDSGKVRTGLMSPGFSLARDNPANMADNGRLRMGTLSPTFPPVRTR